jgi:glutamine synthetase
MRRQPLLAPLRLAAAARPPGCARPPLAAGAAHRALHAARPTRMSIPPHFDASSLGEPQVKGMLSAKGLAAMAKNGSVDTVLVAFPDMYGRLVGKRFDAEYFVESTMSKGTHGCNYLLACDMDMNPVPGFDFANWEKGYGDVHIQPDLSTLRLCSWQQRSAMVIADVLYSGHELLPVAPRSLLRRQEKRASELGYRVMAASELEFYMYETSYRAANDGEYSRKALRAVSAVVEDYHTLQTAREEKWVGEFRRHLKASGVPVEGTKGEAGVGQHELNVIYSDIATMSDRHAVYKQCIKELADQMQISVTFMPKPFSDATGSGCHIHLNLAAPDGRNLFAGDHQLGPVRCSPLFRHFLAGWLRYTPDVMVFYAPTINSYKRFVSASWAPTRLAWSFDNRTAGFRIVGEGKSLRIECRIPGADANPYLAFAGSLASGLAGVRQKLEPPPLFEGDVYQARQIPEVPKTLREAVALFRASEMAREAFGPDVVAHYAHHFESEQRAFDRAVTDWERARYFEQI